MRDALDCVVLCLAFAVGIYIGGCVTHNHDEKQAVKSGHAEYYLDENNNKQWRWK